MADTLSIGLIRYFNVYDKQTKKLKYSKKNFNFDLYKKDFNLNDKTKLEIFDHFLIANNTAFFNEPSFPNKGTTTPSYLKPTNLNQLESNLTLQIYDSIKDFEAGINIYENLQIQST